MFSERKGINVPTKIQFESVDESLRNLLWNLLDKYVWQKLGFLYRKNKRITNYWLTTLWNDYYKKTYDTIPQTWFFCCVEIKKQFFQGQWFEALDFLEVITKIIIKINGMMPVVRGRSSRAYVQAVRQEYFQVSAFQYECNLVFEKELSAYRFVGGLITEITSKVEISVIEESLNSPIDVVNKHLGSALTLFSNRQSPDYCSSINKAILAVEALCKLIAKKPDATLGEALNDIERQIGEKVAPSDFVSAFRKLNSYANDNTRHAKPDGKAEVNSEEAKFMLITCSAFVNYLIAKASKANLI